MENATRAVKLSVPEGLHMRPCSLLQQAAAAFSGSVKLSTDGREADVKSIFDLLALGMAPGDEGELSAEGDGAGALIAALGRMFDTDFEGDDASD